MELLQQDIERIKNLIPGTMALYRVNQGLETLFLSPSIPAISGCSAAEYMAITHKDASDIVIPGDRGRVEESIRSAVSGRGEAECVCRIMHKTNGSVWVHARVRRIGEMRALPVLLVIFENISAETDMFSRPLDHSKRRIYVCERENFELLYANARALADKTGRNYRGQTCFSFIRGHSSPCPNCVISHIPEGRTQHEEDWYDSERDRYYHVESRLISWFGREAWIHYIEEITERKKAEQNLQTAKDELEKIISNIPSGIAVFSWEKNGIKLVAANPFFRNIFGLTETEVHNCGIEDFLQKGVLEEDRALTRTAFAGLFSGKRSSVCVHRTAQKRNGKFIWVYAEGRAVPQDDGTLLGYVSLTDISAQKETEEALRASRERYELAIEGARLTVWQYNIGSRTIVSRRADLSRFGFGKKIENVPDSLLPIIMPEDREKFISMYNDIAEGKPVASGEFWLQSSDKDMPVCERVIYSVIRDSEGKPQKAYGISQNITAQKLEEEKYNRAMSRLLNVSPDAIGTNHLNLTRDICDQNLSSFPAISKLGENMPVDGFFDRVAGLIPDRKQRSAFLGTFSRANLLSCFRNGQTVLTKEFRQYLPYLDETHSVSVRANITQNPKTGDMEAIVCAFDIEKRVKEENIMQRVTNQEYDFIALINIKQGTIEFRNVNLKEGQPPETRTINYEKSVHVETAEHIPQAERDLCLHNMGLSHIVAQLAASDVYSFTYNYNDIGGVLCRKQSRYCYLDESKREILSTRTDITQTYEEEQRRLEELGEALDRAEKASSAKSEFLSNISHDMRTPLNGIIGFTSLALDCPSPSQVRDYLEKIRSSSSFLLALINDTLDLSRIESGRTKLSPALTDSTELLESVITPISAAARQKGVSFVLDRSRAAQGFIWTDRLALQKIILNLLSNAVKFTPPGGRTSLTVEYLDRPAAPALPAPPPAALPPDAGSPAAVTCRIAVCDSGIGIGRDFLPRLYEPFTQERDPLMQNSTGTGLGLSIVKQLVGLMGGSIDVDTEKGRGTRFTVLLPLLLFPDCRSAPQLQTPPPCSALDGALVLVCEDHPMNLEIARTLLEKRGMKVLAAADGKAGLQAFERSAPGSIAAILMDIRMPVMDGLAASRAIRALRRSDAASVPIIAMTANAFDEDIKASRDAGINAHLAKPIDTQLLYSTLERYISGQSARRMP